MKWTNSGFHSIRLHSLHSFSTVFIPLHSFNYSTSTGFTFHSFQSLVPLVRPYGSHCRSLSRRSLQLIPLTRSGTFSLVTSSISSHSITSHYLHCFTRFTPSAMRVPFTPLHFSFIAHILTMNVVCNLTVIITCLCFMLLAPLLITVIITCLC